MPQIPKPEIRQRILDAAASEFAAHGYEGAGVQRIAERAGISTGNVYRYYRGKQALFGAVMDDDFVAEFDALLEARVEALSGLANLAKPDAAAIERQQTMLRFWIANRERAVILLDRAAGTKLAGYGPQFVQRLVELATVSLRARRGGALHPAAESTLRNVFDGARRAIVSILETHDTESEIRAAFAAFWSFQLAGLAGLTEWVLNE